MAHVLIGWEFGGNCGHAVRLVQLADVLRGRGHKVSFAVQRVDALQPGEAKGSAVWPAPVSPRLLVNTARRKYAGPHSMGDILARLGFDDADLVAAMLRGWLRLFEAIRPDVVIAEYAPFMLLAARGRVPTLAVGTGFDTPPGTMPSFPSLTGGQPAVSEEETLASVNLGLDRLGARKLDALPQIFAAKRQIAATYTELDRYSEWRIEALARPTVSLPPPEIAPGSGEEVFVYAPENLGLDAALWKGLVAAKLPVRVHIPRVDEGYRQGLRAMGFIAEPEPVPFPLIAARSRLLLSHGGHGFVCSGLLAGLPQVVCHIDLEKHILANAVVEMRLGGHVPMARIEPNAFAVSLNQIYQDRSLAERTRQAAPDFHKRYRTGMEEDAADAVAALA